MLIDELQDMGLVEIFRLVVQRKHETLSLFPSALGELEFTLYV